MLDILELMIGSANALVTAQRLISVFSQNVTVPERRQRWQ